MEAIQACVGLVGETQKGAENNSLGVLSNTNCLGNTSSLRGSYLGVVGQRHDWTSINATEPFSPREFREYFSSDMVRHQLATFS